MRKVFLFFALFLAACQTTGSSTIGSGPIMLSPRVQKVFDEYMDGNGSMFAVAIDGASSYFYFYCPEIRCRDTVGERQKSIDGCEKYSNGVPCRIYAIREEIVWDFGGPESDEQASSSSDLRRMEIRWEGHDLLTTTVDLNNPDENLVLSNDLTCSVESDADSNGVSGTWKAICSDGTTAAGTFTSLGRFKGSIGNGVDSNGNEVRYKILPRGST